MIQKLDLEQASAFGDAAGQPEIDVTRCRIAGGMVVHQDKGISGMADRGLKDFPRVTKVFVQRSFRNFADRDQSKTRVQQDHSKRLPVETAHLGSEQLINGFWMIERL